jgi:hypothetical protein
MTSLSQCPSKKATSLSPTLPTTSPANSAPPRQWKLPPPTLGSSTSISDFLALRFSAQILSLAKRLKRVSSTAGMEEEVEGGRGADQLLVRLDVQSSFGMTGWTSRRKMTTSMSLMWMVMAGVDVSIGESSCFHLDCAPSFESLTRSRPFHSLMSSNSLVLKSTIFPEWYQDHIQAWLQCVSCSLFLSPLPPNLFSS